MSNSKDGVRLVDHDVDAPEPVVAASGALVVLHQPFSDQSEADQSAADADRDGSAADLAASTSDQATSSEDQLASDRDQATADRQHDAAVSPTEAEERAYAMARDERQAVSVDREQNQLKRDLTARSRLATSARRDRISRPRARSSAIRKRLVADGVSAQVAVQWCDAWEVEAARTGVLMDDDYWSRGTHWIWTERAAGRAPGRRLTGHH